MSVATRRIVLVGDHKQLPNIVDEKIAKLIEEEYLDKDALAQAWVDADGLGIMSGYDGSYQTTYVNDETYVVMRTN
jgi:hypothetical protein